MEEKLRLGGKLENKHTKRTWDCLWRKAGRLFGLLAIIFLDFRLLFPFLDTFQSFPAHF